MKTEKIVGLTIANAFILMLFATVLSGCQKRTISRSGFYTSVSSTNRTPASTGPLNNFTQIQDPKQIYIYCNLNEINHENCYQHFIERKLTELNKKQIKVNKAEIPSYQDVENEMLALNAIILQNIRPKIKQVVEHREKFCEQNAKHYLERCLHQYVDKESLELVNNLQNQKDPLNGHEYLYLQKQFEIEIKNQLNFAKENIINQKKKAL